MLTDACAWRTHRADLIIAVLLGTNMLIALMAKSARRRSNLPPTSQLRRDGFTRFSP